MPAVHVNLSFLHPGRFRTIDPILLCLSCAECRQDFGYWGTYTRLTNAEFAALCDDVPPDSSIRCYHCGLQLWPSA